MSHPSASPDSLTGDRVFYHGTSRYSARSILREGFRDRSTTRSVPKIRYMGRRGTEWYRHGGVLGNGTYITRNWKTGLFFGPVLFRVELMAGTRLIDLEPAPDPAVIGRLRREFGHQILTRHPLEVMPRNKRLTHEEAVELARHHNWQRMHADFLRTDHPRGYDFHSARLMDLRSILIRHGIHGWGDPVDLDGILIFAADRLRVREVVVSLPTQKLLEACNWHTSCDGPHASLQAMIDVMHRATNRGADNTRRWFHEANRILARRAAEEGWSDAGRGKRGR